MEQDVSNNRSCQVDSDSDDDEPVVYLDDIHYTEYNQEQEEEQNQLLLHWIKLCEDNYGDIRTEEDITHQMEIRVQKLQKIHNKIYPVFKACMRQIKEHNNALSDLSQQYPNCFIHERNSIIPMTKHECRKKLFNHLNQCFSESTDNSIQDLNAGDRKCFVNADDESFYVGYGKNILDIFFRKIGKDSKSFMPDLVVSVRKYPIKQMKVLFQGHHLFLKGRTVFEVLSRLNEHVSSNKEEIREKPTFLTEISENGIHSDTESNKLRGTYVIPEYSLETGSSEDFGCTTAASKEREETQSVKTKCTSKSPCRFSSQSRTFSRGTPLPRISSIHTSKPVNENQCMVEGHAIKKRPLSGPDIIPKTLPQNPEKIYSELPPLFSKRGRRHQGLDLETKHIDKKLNKGHSGRKKIRPNSPIKRPSKIYRTPHHVDIPLTGPDEEQESKQERSLPLPPIKNPNRHKNCYSTK